jgi:hypothetical protein
MTLVEYWNDEAKINEMLDLGDLSYLGEHIGTKRPFENPYKRGTPEHKEYLEFYETACLFYGRDREEEGIDAVTFGSTTV